MVDTHEQSNSKDNLAEPSNDASRSYSNLTDQIESYRLLTEFRDDHIEHRIPFSDRNRGIRKGYKKQRWITLPRVLGRGGFGIVRLQRERKTAQLRAVKEVPHNSETASVIDPVRELIAMAALSKVSICRLSGPSLTWSGGHIKFRSTTGLVPRQPASLHRHGVLRAW